MLLRLIEVQALELDAHRRVRMALAQRLAHRFDHHEAAALGDLDPRGVKFAQRIDGLARDGEARCTLDHAHRREHSPRKPLVVRIAMMDVVAQRQQQLHEQK